MRKRLMVLLVVAAMGVTVLAVPAAAAPPEISDEPIFLLFLDFENDKAVFWNITRDGFCGWQDSGFDGPPPVLELVPASTHETGQGAVVASFKATRDIELWDLDDPSNPVGPCTDTAEQTGPWALGDVSVSSTDNDLSGSGTRTNSFGDSGNGTVANSDGQWHYSWNFTALIDKDGEFKVAAENFNLKRIGR
jgi:hypothetical protein